MSGTVSQRLTDSLQTGAGASRAIATYMLANLSELPFETAMTVAEKVGVSELTVGRFCRSIGYQHFKDLTADLKIDVSDSPWLIGDRLREFQASTFCDWAHDCTSEVFAVPSEINLFWDTNGPMLTLVHLMLNGIIGELGPKVEERLNRLSGLYGDFVSHAGRKT